MSPPLTCSGVGGGFCVAALAAAEQTGEGLSLAVTSAKREVKEGDALL